jgi:16S rRNA G966 N2-methylase RsmD
MNLFDEYKSNCSWFLDPPYQNNYQYKSAPLDYTNLANKIQNLPGQVIVCEAICQKTDMRPSWLPFVDFRRTVTSRRKVNDNHHSRELIFVKG